jgi:hypothetical protein
MSRSRVIEEQRDSGADQRSSDKAEQNATRDGSSLRASVQDGTSIAAPLGHRDRPTGRSSGRFREPVGGHVLLRTWEAAAHVRRYAAARVDAGSTSAASTVFRRLADPSA